MRLFHHLQSESSDQPKLPPVAGRRAVRPLATFAAEIRGTTAVEFALVSPVILLTLLFIMSVGYILFMNQMLDYATQKAARQIRTGAVQAASLTQTQFRTQIVCAYLPSMFNCNDVIVNVLPVNYGSVYHPYEYYLFANAAQSWVNVAPMDNTLALYCPGQKGGYVYLQVLYPVSFLMSLLSTSAVATTYQGRRVFVIMGTATFLNEPFNAPPSAC